MQRILCYQLSGRVASGNGLYESRAGHGQWLTLTKHRFIFIINSALYAAKVRAWDRSNSRGEQPSRCMGGRDLTQGGKRVLVVDDEPDTRALIWDILTEEGYDVHLCSGGEQALEHLGRMTFDLILTDIKMPGMSGLELLTRIRASAPDVRVILMTAYASVDSAIQALREQAFDYLVKPFDLDDFRQRIASALDGGNEAAVLHYMDLAIDRRARWVWVAGRKINLTRLEFNSLAYLFDHQGEAVSGEELLREVWECDDAEERTMATVKSCMSRLRKKIGDDANNPRYIFNVWGVGYRLGE
jgi:two-component system response regulator VanR